ncbi:hypothetical protein BH10BAC3_BH10BAC3_31860 [soil metagenome]
MEKQAIFNNTINDIVKEVKKLTTLEQKEILAQIRIKGMLKNKRKPIANPPKDLKPLTMAQIDKIKHEVRKSYAL